MKRKDTIVAHIRVKQSRIQVLYVFTTGAVCRSRGEGALHVTTKIHITLIHSNFNSDMSLCGIISVL